MDLFTIRLQLLEDNYKRDVKLREFQLKRIAEENKRTSETLDKLTERLTERD